MQKTIFITIFQGVEAKNILRTSILDTLLSNPEVRLVLFTKNPERVEYYKKEFNEPRIIYETVERPRGNWIDRIFQNLKFILLRTETTDLRRKMAYEEKKNLILYYGGLFLNRILACSFIRKFARILDLYLVHDKTYAKYFDKYKPDLVFCAHLFDEQEIHLLREAKRRGIKTIGFINSWDKVTARCILRLLPDKVIVFNGIVKKEMMEHNEVREEDIFVSGLPQYDQYILGACDSRDDFFKKLNINPGKKLIVYAPLGSSFCDSDWDMIDLLYRLNQEGEFGQDVAILVRFQPNDFIDEWELKRRPNLLYDYPGIRFSVSRGVDWDMNFDDLRHLHNTLRYKSLLICYASSMSVDAAIFGKPVINLNFEISQKPAILAKSPLRFYRMTHYMNALKTGGVRLVNNELELIDWINRYLADSSLDREDRKRLVRQQCQLVDGKAGERIGNFILNYLYGK